MRNISRYPLLAQKVVDEFYEKIRLMDSPDMSDWILGLMRQGFSKKEAKALFHQRKLTVATDGTISFPQEQSFQSAQNRRALAIRRSKSALDFDAGIRKTNSSLDAALKIMAEREQRMKAMAETAGIKKRLSSSSLPSGEKKPVKESTTDQHARAVRDFYSAVNKPSAPKPRSIPPRPKRPSVTASLEEKLAWLDADLRRIEELAKQSKGYSFD